MEARIRIRVSEDKMKAGMLVGRPTDDYAVSLEEIMNALKKENIKFGICTERIEEAVNTQSFLAEIPCAKGIPPVDGKDGEIKFIVPTKTELRPRIRDDGTADYHDLGLINEVDEGRLLCKRTRPELGKDGTDVYGNVIHYKPGKLPDFPAGEGTVISSITPLKLVAARSGYIKMDRGIISIPDVFTLNSDVNNGTGDIKFRGSVVINGNVREGFTVSAGGDLVINGSAEGSTLISKGDITVKEGFTGMEDGRIFSFGDVKCRYLQNAILKCKGNLTTEYSLNSFLSVGGEIVAEAGRGTIAGGDISCTGSITAKSLGADTYIATKVAIKDMPLNFWDPDYVPTYVEEPSEEIPENQLSEDMVSITEMNIDASNQEPLSNAARIEMISYSKDAKIVVKNCAYPGTKIQIGMQALDVENELKCTKFASVNGEIVATPTF